MRKQIAVFICAISFDNQRRVLQGILKRAKELDIDVFIFTCHVNYNEDKENKIGAFNVMLLPDLKRYDGIVLMRNSIHYTPVAEELVKRIQKSGVPAVSIDESIRGIHNIGIANYDAQKSIVEYLIREQGLTRINYVTGLVSNWEGKERLRAYEDAIREHGIPLEEKRIYRGNYDASSGRAAVLSFLKNDRNLPEAIVCANDGMALGVIEQLAELGYSVPEHVYVTGFDNDERSQIYIPSLTTVDRRQEDMGELAVNIIVQGTVGESFQFLKPRTIFGESSGNMDAFTHTMQELRNYFTVKNSVIQRAVDAIKHMSLDLAGLESTDELFRRLKKYVRNSDMKSFYLCMCNLEDIFQLKNSVIGDEIDLGDINTEYTEYVSAPVVYRNHTFRSIGKFKASTVLPDRFRDGTEATFYVVSPVYYRNICFGYCISEGSEFVMRSELSSSWVVNIGIALENIRKWLLLNQVVKKLNSVWKYDALTQTYNRSGFYYYAERLLKDMQTRDAHAYLLFMDLDGLKKVNDGLGHEYGDAFIREMADILKESVPEDAVCMRYGGDEFVVFGACEQAEDIEQIISEIREVMTWHNNSPGRCYSVAVSIGSSAFRAQEITNLSSLIEQADMNMYQEKKRKGTR